MGMTGLLVTAMFLDLATFALAMAAGVPLAWESNVVMRAAMAGYGLGMVAALKLAAAAAILALVARIDPGRRPVALALACGIALVGAASNVAGVMG
jgi:hypothetical protein